MSKKSKKRLVQTAKSSRRRSKRRSSQGIHPMAWMGGGLAAVVILVIIGLWRQSVLARSSAAMTASRNEDVADLLPLTEAKLPLRGEHDMARIPQQTPAPQQRPANVSLPRLEVPSMEYDFGTVPARPDVAHIFAVQNRGDVDLKISNLVTSCSCTTAELSSSVIPPGQRADLTVIFDPDFPKTEGFVTRVVWFATNDPSQPWVEVRVDANVEP